jgi:hypothetical protein
MEKIYNKIYLFTNDCMQCRNHKCPGGYNCKFGAFDPTFKVCKNDFQMGDCPNKLFELNINRQLFEPFIHDNIIICSSYSGCVNGHHLTLRGFVSYNNHINAKQDTSAKVYQSYRYIQLNELECLSDPEATGWELSSSSDEIDQPEISEVNKDGKKIIKIMNIIKNNKKRHQERKTNDYVYPYDVTLSVSDSVTTSDIISDTQYPELIDVSLTSSESNKAPNDLHEADSLNIKTKESDHAHAFNVSQNELHSIYTSNDSHQGYASNDLHLELPQEHVSYDIFNELQQGYATKETLGSLNGTQDDKLKDLWKGESLNEDLHSQEKEFSLKESSNVTSHKKKKKKKSKSKKKIISDSSDCDCEKIPQIKLISMK